MLETCLVWLVLEIAVPALAELRAHLVELFLSRPDLNTSFNAVSGKRSSAVGVPLIENGLLYGGVTTQEVVECVRVWLDAVGCECEVVVLPGVSRGSL